MRYLEQLSDTQVAFSVRQKRPKTLAEAVALTLEMESLAIASGVSPCKESPRLCMAGTQTTTDINAQGLLTTLLQRMGKLEDTLAEARMHMGSGKKRNDVQEGHAHSATPVLPINSSSAYKIPAFINKIRVNFLLDTGAAVSLIRRDVWEQVNAMKQQQLSPTGHPWWE
jgi:predicted aspartyl protease